MRSSVISCRSWAVELGVRFFWNWVCKGKHMGSAGRCRECGAVIPPGGPAGLCPKCLLTLAIEQVQGPAAPDSDDADAQSGPKQAAGNSPETPRPQSSPRKLSGPP